MASDAIADPRIAALRERGAHGLEPVRLRYIEALARRSARHSGDVRRWLDNKLEQAIASCSERLPAPGTPEIETISEAEMQTRATALVAPGPAGPGPLAELVAQIDRHKSTAPSAGPGELKTMSQARRTWARLRVGRQLARSLASEPENPGPLNSHLLMLRALRTMQAISPAYLEHFIAYADTLLWLDQASFGGLPTSGNVLRRERDRRRKPGRSKSA